MSADTIACTAFKQGIKPLYDYDKHWAICYGLRLSTDEPC